MRISLAHNAAVLTTSKIINLIIQMVVAMLLSRFRTLEEYGTYSQILIVVNLTTAIFMLGLPSSINYFLARAESETEKNQFISVYYTLSTLLGASVAIILTLSIDLIEKYFNNQLISSFLYFIVIIPWTRILSSSIDHLLIFYNRTKVLLYYRIFNSISILLVVILTRILSKPFSFYMILHTLVNVIFTLAIYFITSKMVSSLTAKLNFSIIKRIFNYSFPIGVASVIGTISLELDKLFISKVMDVESLAIYTNAARELPITFISASITAVLMPHMIQLIKNNKKDEAISLWRSSIIISFTVICFFASAIFHFSSEVITLLYSEKYISGNIVFKIYTLVLLLRVTYFGMILNATGHTKLILYSSLSSLILNFILNIILFNCLGFIGPAIATLIATLLVNMFQLIISSRLLDIGFRLIFPWKELFIILGLNFLSGYIVLKVRAVIFPSTESMVSAMIIGSIWASLYFLFMRKPIKKEINALNRPR